MARVGPRGTSLQANNRLRPTLLAALLLWGCASTRPSGVDPNDPGAAYAHIRAESQRGDFSQAMTDAQRCYAGWLSRPDAKWHWQFKLLNAEMLLLNGETRQASALLRSPPPTGFADLQPRFQMLRGYVAFREGRDSEARVLLLTATAAAQGISDYELAADAQLLLAAYASADDAAQSERIIGGILELGKAHNLRYQVAAALLDLGLLRIHQSRFAAAIPDFEQAARTAREVDARLLNSISLGNLATCYYNLGDFDKALELRKQAIAIQQQSGLTTLLRDSYLELGSSQLLQGQTREAIESLRRALTLASEADTPELYSLIACNLASALETTGALDEAERMTQRAIAANKDRDAEAKSALLLNQAAIAEHRGQHDGALGMYKRVLAAGTASPSAAWSASAAMASIYSAANSAEGNRAARRHFESALRTIEASRAEQLQSKYKITFLSRLIRFYQDYVAFLMREGDSREALLVADSSRASVLTQDVTGLNSRQSRDLIPRVQKLTHGRNATILFYLLAPGQSYLWIVTEHALKTAILPSERELGDQVRSYRDMLETEKLDPLRSASALPSRLFQTLVGPALQSIGPNGVVAIVPDGALHGLNFETLVASKPQPHYWIEDVTVSIAPSLAILARADSGRRAPHASLLIIGDPEPASAEFARLPYAGAEMETVRGHFQERETTVVRGTSAVPTAYRAAQPRRFSTLHFAAHAETNERSPLDSAIILSPQTDGYRLYAREIMEVPLSADLVTLSACRSAGARTLSGEGPVGFAWAFFQAGAENVVASLWDVNDRSTAGLMNSFYGAIDQGAPYALALRRAKLQMLQTNFQKPYYWAPFQLFSRQLR